MPTANYKFADVPSGIINDRCRECLTRDEYCFASGKL